VARKFQFDSMYSAHRQDKDKTWCGDCGGRLTMLSARCMSKLPSFYICEQCPYIGEIGVGVVRKGKKK
jgi:hypothetical protein